MKLAKEQIENLAHSLLQSLETKKLIHYKKTRDQAYQAIINIIAEDMKAEDQLNSEAQNILQQYKSKAAGPIDADKMLKMIKKELQKKYNRVQ